MGIFGAIATAIMVLMLVAGAHMTVMAAVELTLASAWLLYLWRSNPTGYT